MPELDRRDFLKIVGLGAGAAAVAGCSDKIEKLVPYVIQPESVTPGISTVYASSCKECPTGCGLHVKTREGRPIKLEGNPAHPINRGALCARGQVGFARTYHPDRYDGPLARSASGSLEGLSWKDATAKVQAKLQGAGSGTWVLGGPVGPSLSGVIDGFVEGTGAGGRVVYEPFAFDALRAATEQVFGIATLPIFDLSGTDLIVDFGFDFLDSGTASLENARQFADARDVEKHKNGGARLVSVSPRMNLTTENADQWIPARPGREGLVALALAKAVASKKGVNGAVAKALDAANADGAASKAGIEAATLDALADKLVHAKHAVALPPGVSVSTTVATAANAAVLLLNAALGAVGTAITLPDVKTQASASMDEIKALVKAMNAGQVKLLLIHDSNPVYSLPDSLGFAEALAKVDTVVSFAPLKDETSEAASVVLPDHTAMESWGDIESRPGVRSVVQPTIRPLKDTRSMGDTLLGLGRAAGADLPDGDFLDVVKANWAGHDWTTVLSTGGVFGAVRTADIDVSSAGIDLAVSSPAFEGTGDYTLVAFPHSYQSDGSGAALPWTQETPHPVTKLSWNSWAEMSFATAESLGVTFGDVVQVTAPSGTIEVSAFPRGGIRDDVIAIPIGQGHTVGYYASMELEGETGQARGVNVLDLLPSATDGSGSRVFLGTKVQVEKTGRFRRLALAQWSDNQRDRGLAPEMSLLALAEGTHNVAHFDAQAAEGGGESAEAGHGEGTGDESHHLLPFDPAFDAKPGQPYRWGMVIDNDRCNGCGACTVACYTENNISLVGETQAIKHRELTWLRIERYVGDGDREGGQARRPFPNREKLGEIDVRRLPMPCQHCGAAPCEAVCPVIGTYHTDEGINGMVYNRCVGTRYCGNNCTYKVRRFNYWDYGNDNWPGMLGLMLNPDVTVRQQGVMEKCSFCVQRIETARQPAKDEGRDIVDGEVVTACQQTCPTSAITFGNWREEGAEINKLVKDNPRNYNVLHVLNTRPAVTYLAQVSRDDQEGQH